MNKRKIFNDPVYGFVTIKYPIIFDLIEHRYYQRLRRIKQLSLTHYVYPGALHTRFHHAIGAQHLMNQAIEILREKGVKITEAEAVGAAIAILLHDVGHGPFSHTLEHTLINSVHHEELSLLFMEKLNEEFNGQLSLAIRIFKNEYPKRFLHQLISGQLDMDRMDYLNRDSFFTGVSEGVIGYDRIIKMLSVKDNKLVVEEKGIYSVEKFLIARRLMYWQVYFHKTVLAAEQLLIKVMQRAKELAKAGVKLPVSDRLSFFLYQDFEEKDFLTERSKLLWVYGSLDDFDVVSALKNFMAHDDFILSTLSKSLIHRQLFKIELNNEPFERDYVLKIRQNLLKTHDDSLNEFNIKYLVFEGKETNSAYSILKDEINILYKDGHIKPMSEASDYGIQPKIVTKYYLIYPKNTKFVRP